MTPTSNGVVCSWTEWDPLEEVIVGTLDGACLPAWTVMVEATMPEQHHEFFRTRGGQPFPPDLVCRASDELELLTDLLKSQGVKVRRPDRIDFANSFGTAQWRSPAGLYSAMPRDVMLIVGDEIIEAPMAWRCRHHEIHAYRTLIKEYFRAGARWSAAPHPELKDELYATDWCASKSEGAQRYAISEFEPVFDAADFSRCGTDIFYQKSNVTNDFGISWLKNHLNGRARLHEVKMNDARPMHIDASFVPLAHGKLLVNPERFQTLPPALEGWEILPAPPPQIPDDYPLFMSSKWVSMNVLSLDEKRVIVEQGETNLASALYRWGFEPIPCPFRSFNAFGGSFHCATLDVRRRGEPRPCAMIGNSNRHAKFTEN